jgi:subtilisin family serine protease
LTDELELPAWSEPFTGERREALTGARPFADVTRDWAFGGATGAGLTVAIIDSGVEVQHPAVGGRVRASMRVELAGADGEPEVVDDPAKIDVVGHGTACAGIIHGLAPEADLVSIRVLGPDNRGKGAAFAAALEWAIDAGASVVNLSLSSRSEALYGTFHDLADRAYFANVLLVSAANNVPGPSYPSLFAAVVSVAAHDVADAWTWFYNPAPPVEFGGYGVDVDVAWRESGRITATGNSFAAPHLAGLAALIRSKHRTASPFEVKAILAATSNGARPEGDERRRSKRRGRRD